MHWSYPALLKHRGVDASFRRCFTPAVAAAVCAAALRDRGNVSRSSSARRWFPARWAGPWGTVAVVAVVAVVAARIARGAVVIEEGAAVNIDALQEQLAALLQAPDLRLHVLTATADFGQPCMASVAALANASSQGLLGALEEGYLLLHGLYLAAVIRN